MRNSKSDPLVQETDLLHCNERYAIIRKASGEEDTVSLRDLAPVGSSNRGGFSDDNNEEDKDFSELNVPTESSSGNRTEEDRIPDGLSPRRSGRARSRPNWLHYTTPGECRDTT